MLEKSKQLESQMRGIQNKLKKMPEGKLICSHTGPYCKWERSDGHKKTYIPKKDRELAEKLAAKKYLSALWNDLKHEKDAIDLYLRRHSNYEPQVDKLLTDSTEVVKLLSPYLSPLSKELEEWMNSPYEKNLKHPEYLTQKIGMNQFVRSKSEAMIAKVLKQHKIPYRYEAKLELDGVTIYPDFTIRHPKTGDFFYWEHFGLLDNQEYIKNMHLKLQTFTSNNLMPGICLIMTYENQEHPLTFEMIEILVKYYFL
ncbi:MAG: ATPase [Agathobacter sp.]|nr:ATPase [Agathobacter sp.]